MKWTLTHAVISTLAYAQLFEYPLKEEELFRWLIHDSEVALDDIKKVAKKFQTDGAYYSLQYLPTFVKKRNIRNAAAVEKWLITNKTIVFLQHIPTIDLIGISGGLAMENADPEDDIDLFVIVAPGTIWITRIIILLLLQILGRRRKINSLQTVNLLCPNMFLDSNHLTINSNEQDLYSAHEVLQMIPVYERNDMYINFLHANSWVKKYLPNAWKESISKHSTISSKENVLHNVFLTLIKLLNNPANYLQRWYMQSHITTEIVTDEVLRFHPRDVRVYIRKHYSKLLRKYKVPLDSSFFNSLK